MKEVPQLFLIFTEQVIHLDLIDAFQKAYDEGVNLRLVFRLDGFLGARKIVVDGFSNFLDDGVLPDIDSNFTKVSSQLLLYLCKLE